MEWCFKDVPLHVVFFKMEEDMFYCFFFLMKLDDFVLES